MSEAEWMIYGANGYSGELIAREAKKRKLSPVLAGRSSGSIEKLAQELDLSYRVFSLDTPEKIAGHLANMKIVLHCAGPFSKTSAPMMEACFLAKTHYLDITGEISVFEAAASLDKKAQDSGIILMPGVGFDVVPTDCLALTLKNLLPDAHFLTLAFASEGGPSKGTAKTMVEGMGQGGKVRQEGKIISVPFAYKVREIPFSHKTCLSATIPWGDVSTAYYTTGIPNIEVYLSTSPRQVRHMKWGQRLKPILASSFVQNYLKKKIDKGLQVPTTEQRDKAKSYIWGEVKNKEGKSRQAHLVTPNGYNVTVDASVSIVQRMLQGEDRSGAYTPAKLMGPDFITQMNGTELTIIE